MVVIANPIHDIIFKKVMDNIDVAKFLIGTILNCKVLTLEPQPQEHTYYDNDDNPRLFRMDFAANIQTQEEGERKVLIEVQKVRKDGVVERFRKYLGNEYIKSVLPIITIYILGFNLDVDSPIFEISPIGHDSLNHKRVDSKHYLVKAVTHTSYFIQTKRISPSDSTLLEKLLSVFEQDNFLNDEKTIKSYNFPVTEPGLTEMVDILQLALNDAEVKEKLKEELYYQEYVTDTFGKVYKEIADKTQLLAEKDDIIADQKGIIAESKITLVEKDKALADAILKQKETAKYLKHLGTPFDTISVLTGLSVEEIEQL